MTERWLDDLREIARLLDEAMRRYQDTGGDYWKSAENTITLTFGNYWDRDGYNQPGNLVDPEVTIYAYVVGPSRTHEFKSTTDALAAVRRWHERMWHDTHGRTPTP